MHLSHWDSNLCFAYLLVSSTSNCPAKIRSTTSVGELHQTTLLEDKRKNNSDHADKARSREPDPRSNVGRGFKQSLTNHRPETTHKTDRKVVTRSNALATNFGWK